jgi:uncharacterized protein YndB with AHSA1/START domain
MSTTDELTLRLTRTLPARREGVWRAITAPEQLVRWWGPKGFAIPSVDFAPQVGGRYRIAMQPPKGEPFHLHGQFREVDPPSILAYSFVWDPPDPDDRETVATLSLEDRGDQTEISLTQGAFATQARLEVHQSGWTDSLDRLEELLG